jgi:hypothetical protein
VRGLLTTLKKIFFWNYARNSWQWDVLCAVILVFIFLTPKSWFTGSERPGDNEHQNPTITTVYLGPEVVANAGDRGQIEQRVRAITGRNEVSVLSVRKVVAPDGSISGFEVDIR